MTEAIKIILASRSPRRKKILKKAGYKFEIFVPEVEEITQDGALETVQFNALLKARAAAESKKNCLIIAADTVVSRENRILEKPKDLTEAKEMLLYLSGKEHEVYSAVTIIIGCNEVSFFDVSKVKFKELDEALVQEYFNICDPLDKAGAYNIDEGGEVIIENISGSYENIMGLPVEKVKKYLKNFNF